MFDIGVNLTSGQLAGDLDEVVAHAHGAGIRGMAITGTDLEDSRAALALCRQLPSHFPGLLCSTAGVHPHHAKSWSSQVQDEILALCADPQVRAVGETGLDYNRNFSPRERQLEAFAAQLDIAAQTGLPLFLHERDAFEDQIALLREFRAQISDAVVHCFTGTRDQLHAYLELDFYIGITGWVCDERRGVELATMVSDIPLSRLLVETDAPWLLPRNIVPLPSQRRNEPAYLVWVLRKLSECYGVPVEELAARTEQNALNFFRLKP